MSEYLTVGMPISSFLPNLGGAEVGLHNIATRLHARGHRPVVIAPAPHCRALRAEGWDLPYAVKAFPPKVWGVLRHAPSIGFRILDSAFARIDRRESIDVWHGTIGYPVGVALVHYAAARGKPHFVRCAGEDIQRDPEIGYGMRLDPKIDAQISRWLPRADRMIAITESVAAEYRDLGIPEAKIAHIPNGVDLGRFSIEPDRARVRRTHGISPDTFLFICVGRNHPKKNYRELLKALSKLPPNAGSLALIGAGVGALADYARDLAIANRVHLIETLPGNEPGTERSALPSDGLVALYRSADAFVFSSRIETFGIVLVEAMAAGLPVITTDAPGCRDVVRKGLDGLTVAVGDVDGLSAAMLSVYDDAALRTRLAEAARVRAADFSWDAITDAYVALYRELMATRSGTRRAAAE